MLYKLKVGESVFNLNPGLLAVEAYANLSDNQMMFVCLVADPSKDNPIKTLSGKERRERAAILSGYKFEPDGARLDKNGRNLVYGKVPNVEKAIEEFKLNHYNQHQHNKEALKKQIAEIREFLESDKRIPLIDKGKVVVDNMGEPISIVDQKALKLASELGVKLPDLEKAYNELEAIEPEDNKFEGLTYTSNDIPEEMMDTELNAIDTFHQINNESST